jgi:hypothetical protein
MSSELALNVLYSYMKLTGRHIPHSIESILEEHIDCRHGLELLQLKPIDTDSRLMWVGPHF